MSKGTNGKHANGNGHAVKLRYDPRNARKHSERNKSLIAKSLQEIGGGRSILVDGENIVRAGNGVYEQAQALGLNVRVIDAKRDELIAVRRKDLRGKDAIRAAALDNLAADSSAFDYDAEILASIAASDDLIAQIASEEQRIAALLAGAERIVDDPTAEWEGMPEHVSDEIRDNAICCLVRFLTEEDREKFENLLGYKLHHKGKTYTTWFPKQYFNQSGKGLEFQGES